MNKLQKDVNKDFNILYDRYFTNLAECANKFNYDVTILNENAFLLCTKLEKWIIHINLFISDKSAQVTLYHKNLFQQRKVQCNEYPDYHLQFNKIKTVGEIVRYVRHHEEEKYSIKTHERIRI